MSTELRSLERSFASVDVEVVRVPPDEAGQAIDGFVAERAVGVALDRDDAELPDSVTVDPTPSALEAATVGVTPAAFAIADYGSLVLPLTNAGSELVSLYVDRHVAILDEGDVATDMDEAFARFEAAIPDVFQSAIIATGPSATADMGTLVNGAHGPSEVCLILVTEA